MGASQPGGEIAQKCGEMVHHFLKITGIFTLQVTCTHLHSEICLVYGTVELFIRQVYVYCYVTGSIPAVKPRYCTIEIENALRSTKKILILR
jgi:hypothetical protein